MQSTIIRSHEMLCVYIGAQNTRDPRRRLLHIQPSGVVVSGDGGGGGRRRWGWGAAGPRRQWDISSRRQRCRWVYYNIIHTREPGRINTESVSTIRERCRCDGVATYTTGGGRGVASQSPDETRGMSSYARRA